MGVAVRDSPDYEGVGLPSHNIEKGDVEDLSFLAVSWALRLYNRSLAKLAPELPILFLKKGVSVSSVSARKLLVMPQCG